MAIADFESLCNGFCEVAGMQAPALAPDDKGVWSATVRMRGVTITVVQYGATQPGTAYLIAELGTLPEDRALEGWLALMNANLLMIGEHAPVYSRNANTGAATLQWACPMSSLTVVDIYQRINEMIEVATRWRHDYFAGAGQGAAFDWGKLSSAPAASADAGRTAFEQLYVQVCEAVGQPAPALPTGEGTRSFPLEAGGLQFSVVHSTEHQPDCAFVLLYLGEPTPAPTLDEIAVLMDANFLMLTQRNGVAFSRDTASGALLLHYAFPLADSTAERLLKQIGALAQLMHQLHAAGQAQQSASGDAQQASNIASDTRA